MPSAKAVSVDMVMAQPWAEARPALKIRKPAMGTTVPPSPARRGRATRRRSLSSPMSNSRRTSRPAMKKNSVISPLLTQ